jgi:hypothetical protein
MGSLLRLIVVCLTSFSIASAQIEMPVGPTTEANTPNSSKWLSLETLGMRRSSIEFGDAPLRLFNGWGAVSLNDQSVTGLQKLLFPPVDLPNYNFSLSFREAKSGVLIQDTVPDIYLHQLETGAGINPLGLNFTRGEPYVLLWQRAYWQPNAMFRTGTFHKEFNGHWISFGLKTKTSVSARADEVYLAVEIENRETEPLSLTVIPNQRTARSEDAGAPANKPVGPSASAIVTVESDLPGEKEQTQQVWKWEVPAKSSRTAYFAIVIHQPASAAPAVFSTDLAQRMTEADLAWKTRLASAADSLPEVSSDDPLFNNFYRRCILSVLETQWKNKNFVIDPFYAVGTWTDTVAWDTSYASQMLSYLDPAGLRQTLLLYLKAGLLKSSYIPWDGKLIDYWYAQTPFAAMRVLQDYLVQTGDEGLLDQKVGGTTVFETMKQTGVELRKRFGRPDGLLDFGPGSEKMIEIRTDGYQHTVAADNGLAFAYFRQVAAWAAKRHDPDAAQFSQWADQIQQSMTKELWDEKNGWFLNLYPDGTRHLVWSYHQFELLDTGMLSTSEQQRLTDHIKEGEFLGPYGMYSMSKSDQTHWDREDADFGGGGQYAGQPLRVSESLYRLGNAELAWNVLSRCLRWAEYSPYIPQSIFTDFPGHTQVEMDLELSAGSGVQAIMFGVFGLRLHQDNSLHVSPSYHHELGVARMTGYRFRGHLYDVVMGPWNYEVYRDGKLAATNTYGTEAMFPAS